MQPSGPFWEEHGTVSAGDSKVVEMPVSGDVGAAVYPGADGSALIEATISPLARVQAGTAKWFAWDKGSVAADTIDLTIGPVRALRITATDADCDYDVLCRPAGQ
jgi:hypothetical protein